MGTIITCSIAKVNRQISKERNVKFKRDYFIPAL
jgi:hypothetical protein